MGKRIILKGIDFEAVRHRLIEEKEKFGKKEWIKIRESALKYTTGVKRPDQIFSNIIGKGDKFQNPSMELIYIISKAIGKPIEYFLYGEEPEEAEKTFIKIRHIATYTENDNSLIEIDAHEFCYFKYEWLKKITNDPWNLVCMVMEGDTMTPTIQRHSIVLINTSKKTIKDGLIFAFNLSKLKHIQIKRLAFCGDKIAIISDNKELYEKTFMELDKINIIGEVDKTFQMP